MDRPAGGCRFFVFLLLMPLNCPPYITCVAHLIQWIKRTKSGYYVSFLTHRSYTAKLTVITLHLYASEQWRRQH